MGDSPSVVSEDYCFSLSGSNLPGKIVAEAKSTSGFPYGCGLSGMTCEGLRRAVITLPLKADLRPCLVILPGCSDEIVLERKAQY